MGHLLTRTQIQRLVAKHGREVIEHRHMQIERCYYQHGNVTTFEPVSYTHLTLPTSDLV